MTSRHSFTELSFTFTVLLIKLCRASQICNYSLCSIGEVKAKQCPPRYHESPCDKSQNDWLWHHGEGLQSFEVEREKMPECVLCFMACAFLSKGPAFIFVSQSQGINHDCLSLFCPQPFSFSVCRFCSISLYYHCSLSLFFFLTLCIITWCKEAVLSGWRGSCFLSCGRISPSDVTTSQAAVHIFKAYVSPLHPGLGPQASRPSIFSL